jgi:hypothetical protein
MRGLTKRAAITLRQNLLYDRKLKLSTVHPVLKHYTKKRRGKFDCDGGEWELYDLATLRLEKLFPVPH